MRMFYVDIKNTTSSVFDRICEKDVYTSFLNSLGAAHAYLSVSAPLHSAYISIVYDERKTHINTVHHVE
jgi:hypothetical protein